MNNWFPPGSRPCLQPANWFTDDPYVVDFRRYRRLWLCFFPSPHRYLYLMLSLPLFIFSCLKAHPPRQGGLTIREAWVVSSTVTRGHASAMHTRVHKTYVHLHIHGSSVPPICLSPNSAMTHTHTHVLFSTSCNRETESDPLSTRHLITHICSSPHLAAEKERVTRCLLHTFFSFHTARSNLVCCVHGQPCCVAVVAVR